MTTDDRVAEVDFGEWDGLTAAEIDGRWPGLREEWYTTGTVAAPDGESVADVGRACAARSTTSSARTSRTRLRPGARSSSWGTPCRCAPPSVRASRRLRTSGRGCASRRVGQPAAAVGRRDERARRAGRPERSLTRVAARRRRALRRRRARA
ncbi:histidine phosphatase family protein [Cellulosimicrobium sp. CUA-896]|uniref:histidine phosphatase family protein n=1 Tax=Cellulosimicrobium sp. CUA-896 TaxID=1517881 RepID=UPI0021019C64|nr:histidine phosphatase family protein [Cellulosimicrobium sp. CUA-896]